MRRRVALRGTFYLAQLTKYLPAGGVIQAASQSVWLRLRAFRCSERRSFPGLGVGAFVRVRHVRLWSRLRQRPSAAGPERWPCLSRLTVVLFHRPLMARGVRPRPTLVPADPRRRISSPASATSSSSTPGRSPVGGLCGVTPCSSLAHRRSDPGHRRSVPSRLSWAVGFLAVPIPAGVGVRDAVLVAAFPVWRRPRCCRRRSPCVCWRSPRSCWRSPESCRRRTSPPAVPIGAGSITPPPRPNARPVDDRLLGADPRGRRLPPSFTDRATAQETRRRPRPGARHRRARTTRAPPSTTRLNARWLELAGRARGHGGSSRPSR